MIIASDNKELEVLSMERIFILKEKKLQRKEFLKPDAASYFRMKQPPEVFRNF